MERDLKRNTGIEILRIIAMFLICLDHFTYSYEVENCFDCGLIYKYAHQFLYNFGNLGNAFFATVSAYFLVDSKKVKLNKIISIDLELLLLNIIILIVFMMMGKKIGFTDKLSNFFPILHNNHWYITAYVFYYSIHKYINEILEKYSKNKLFIISIFFIILYFILPIWPKLNPPRSSFTAFIIIHIIVYYNKKFMVDFNKDIKKNYLCFALSSFIYIIGNIIVVFIKSHFHYDFLVVPASMLNPTLILLFISSINIMKHYDKNSSFINYIASLMMIVYFIHENKYIRILIRQDIWGYMVKTYEENVRLMLGIGISIICFFVLILLSIIYDKIVKKVINKISIQIENKINLITD